MIVAFEGIDGSGITTQSKLFTLYLQRHGIRAVYTKEPSLFSKVIRKITENRLSNRLLSILFVIDRLFHLLKLIPYRSYIVVMDRYKYSNMAYQGSYAVNLIFPEADILVYLDTSIEVSLERIGKRKKIYAFERKDNLVLVKRRFLHILAKVSGRKETKVVIVREKEGRGKVKNIGEIQEEIIKKVIPHIRH